MMPYKRPAADKSGMPVYQPSATTYQQLMQLQQQPFVPVSCEYSSPPPPVPASSSPAAAAPAPPPAAAAPEPPNAANKPPTVPELSQPVTPQVAPADTVSQIVCSDAAALPSMGAIVSIPSIPPIPTMPTIPSTAASQTIPPPPTIDAAALAKEVAQQNYAKAVKLAAVSQSYGINSALTALNYTGVALNKQPVAIPPPTIPRYSTLPFAFSAPTPPGMGLTGLHNPYAAQAATAAAQPNLLAFSRPPPAVINPYSFLRPANPLYAQQGHLLAAQYPTLTPQVALPQTSVALPTQTNNNVMLQPYKKMKTT